MGTSPPGTLKPGPGLVLRGKNTEEGSTPGKALNHAALYASRGGI